MGIIRQKFDFDSMVVHDEFTGDEFNVFMDKCAGTEEEQLRFYKDAKFGKLSFDYSNFLELEKNIIERYGEQRVKEYLES